MEDGSSVDASVSVVFPLIFYVRVPMVPLGTICIRKVRLRSVVLTVAARISGVVVRRLPRTRSVWLSVPAPLNCLFPLFSSYTSSLHDPHPEGVDPSLVSVLSSQSVKSVVQHCGFLRGHSVCPSHQEV